MHSLRQCWRCVVVLFFENRWRWFHQDALFPPQLTHLSEVRSHAASGAVFVCICVGCFLRRVALLDVVVYVHPLRLEGLYKSSMVKYAHGTSAALSHR